MWKRAPTLERVHASGRFVTRPEAGSPVVTLNGGAAAVWDALATTSDSCRIAEELGRFGARAPVDDARRGLGELERHGLVVRVPGPATEQATGCASESSVDSELAGASAAIDRRATDPVTENAPATRQRPWRELGVGTKASATARDLFAALAEASDSTERPTITPSWGPAELTELTDQNCLALAAAANLAGEILLSPEQAETIHALHAEQLHHALLAERTLLAAASTLEGLGIDGRVLKGAATAHLDYDDPTERLFLDIDLLVPEVAFGDAFDGLLAVGYSPIEPAGRATVTHKSLALVGPEGVVIDLHQRLFTGALGLATRTDLLFETFDEIEIAGRTIRAMAPPGRLLHCLGHQILTSARDIGFWDAALLIGKVHPAEVVELARASRHEHLLTQGLRLLIESVPSSASKADALAAELRPTFVDRVICGDARSYEAGVWRREVASLLSGRRPRTTARYLAAKAFPGDAYLAGTHRSLPGHLGRGAKQLASRRPGVSRP